MKKKLFVFAMSILFLQAVAFGQNNAVIDNAVAKLKAELTNHVIEKAYLHFDRPYLCYVAGDVVYFKAYVTMGQSHEPSTISNVLHVDLIGKNNTLMRSIVIQLNSGTGWGDFTLPDTLEKGTYRIRAYTEWMQNYGQSYFFNQYISFSSINNVDRVAHEAKQSVQPGLQFFPEGGNLAAELPSKVAFKAVGTDGLGLNVKGVVVDNSNKEIAKITSTHSGMGVFSFIPEGGKGITLAVNNDDPAKVSIEIKSNRAYYKENLNKDLNLLIYSAGNFQTVKTKLTDAILGLDLPSKTFKTGVLQVTLLSETGEPLNERLAFIQNPDLLNIAVNTDKSVYNKRENVQININVKNKDGDPVNGSFSAAVIDESKILVEEDSENTILSYLLLSSELKGYIEKPNYYFADVTKNTRSDLDVLMLTQGYRRFVWKQLLNSNMADEAQINPEKGIKVAGQIKTKEGVPIANCKISLVSQDGGLVFSQETDEQGKFSFISTAFLSGAQFILKIESSFRKDGVLVMDSPKTGPNITLANANEVRYNANADILASLQNNQQSGVMTASNEPGKLVLKNDKVMGVKRNSNYISSNLGGAGHADQVIDGNQIINSPTLSIGLNGLARGVQFISGVPSLNTGMVVTNGQEILEPMLVMVDGTNMGVGANIDLVNPISVQTIEILKGTNAVIYGMQGSQGVIVITTKQGIESKPIDNKEMSPGIYSITAPGFYKAREFYSPQYNVSQQSNNIQDQRTTIFWKPDVITDASGNASLNFFNADGTGTYRVVIEGIDNKGNLGRQVFKYKVQ